MWQGLITLFVIIAIVIIATIGRSLVCSPPQILTTNDSGHRTCIDPKDSNALHWDTCMECAYWKPTGSGSIECISQIECISREEICSNYVKK